jgi:hypothetical protein
MTTPSQRLRDDLDGLERLASAAPPDECDWSYSHYADNIRSALIGLDNEFAALQAELRNAKAG